MKTRLKNLTIKQITQSVSLFVASLSVIIYIGLIVTGFLDLEWYYLILLILLQMSLTYVIVHSFLERFIFRKIKLIYKFISDSKRSVEKGSEMDYSETSMDDINSEVIEWGKNKEDEIQALKSLENYRKNYVGNISHELKTPIFSIQGYLHTLLEGALYDEKINVRYLKRAASNADRLQNIVDDLEIISRLESDNASLNYATFGIRQLTEEIMEDLRSKAEEKSISIHFKAGADQEFQVSADREAIHQVLINLLVNSIKYGIEGGLTKVGFYDVDDTILVEVADNGIGIEKEHLKHVFDRFYRIDNSRSRKQGGSGLGLSIVKHLIEAHQQNISVRSTVDLGSTFGFTLEKEK